VPAKDPAPFPASLPSTGLVVVGTAAAVGAIVQQLDAFEPRPVVAGCILLDGAAPPRRDALGVPVLGGPADLPAIHARLRLRLAIVSVPRRHAAVLAGLERTLREIDVPWRTVPPLADLLDAGEAPPPSVRHARVPAPLDLAALIGRRPHPLDRAAVAALLGGKRVLITGAGGSIGSELARVAAGFAPASILLMERSENALFEIDRHLAERAPATPRRAILHDVADADGTRRHLDALRPDIVFHAAAHKHVPLMEDHPAHAVTNNLFGTKAIADAAVAVEAERFVMISSDKAVNPRSVMGATKRLAEIYVGSLARPAARTRLSMVRFGNVLGSACSVLTIWSQQLAEGGPLTVTDPRMTRFFMTIPEAASLVIQSAAVDPGSAAAPVYVLDMGEPVRILDLAVRFVRAHGLSPRLPDQLADRPLPGAGNRPDGEVIDIVFTGVRPGEKLHEELAYPSERLRPTGFPGIHAWMPPHPDADSAAVAAMITDLDEARRLNDPASVVRTLRAHLPEMAQAHAEIAAA
jgi:FlaA1/EpsC-like NDP-sugar epimerase